MVQITIVGNILDSSGYSIHTRQLANSLSKICDVKLTTQIPQNAVTLLTDKEIEMIKKPDKGEVNLIITSPVYWKRYLTAKRNWAFLVFEGNKIPKSYLTECMNPDIEYIFVPSHHTREAIVNTCNSIGGVENSFGNLVDKVKIIPHGVNLDLFYPKEKPDKFTFLCNKGWRHLEDRGGIQYAVRAYLEEFTNQDNINLIIKINPAYGIPDVNKLINEIAPKDKKDFPPMQINADNINYNKLVDLYNKAHVLVAPSRADAFNIPGIEAMACGLPIITTNFGGQSDYCNDNNSWVIGGDLTEVTWELLYEGVSWITPSIPELRKAMREAYFQWEKEAFNKKVDKCLETAKQFTWDNTAQKIVNLI